MTLWLPSRQPVFSCTRWLQSLMACAAKLVICLVLSALYVCIAARSNGFPKKDKFEGPECRVLHDLAGKAEHPWMRP